jgi:hypothetical protein
MTEEAYLGKAVLYRAGEFETLDGYIVGFDEEMPSFAPFNKIKNLSGKLITFMYFSHASNQFELITTNAEEFTNDPTYSAISIEQCNAALKMFADKKAAAEVAYAAIKAQEKAINQEFKADCVTRLPDNAKAVIVAHQEVYDSERSDPMADYNTTKKVRTIILGFSSHTRKLFPEMRKLALNHEDTAFLSELPTDNEVRDGYRTSLCEKTSSWERGWFVTKVQFYSDDRAGGVPLGEWALGQVKAKKAKIVKPTKPVCRDYSTSNILFG